MFPVEAHRQAVVNAHRLMTKLTPDSEEFYLARDNFYNPMRIFAAMSRVD